MPARRYTRTRRSVARVLVYLSLVVRAIYPRPMRCLLAWTVRPSLRSSATLRELPATAEQHEARGAAENAAFESNDPRGGPVIAAVPAGDGTGRRFSRWLRDGVWLHLDTCDIPPHGTNVANRRSNRLLQ